MIERIVIMNYQSHKETILDFHEGVNVIIGSSDSGKSAILKSMNWLINNQPIGDSFRSHWGGTTEIVMQILANKSSQQIHRIKNNTTNEYRLNRNDGSKILSFKSFGKSGVPDEIIKAINMSAINFQYQIDRPFLLSNTSGEVSRYLNKIANLDEIDSSMLSANSYIKKSEKRLNELQDAEEHFKEEMARYNNLPTYQNSLKEVNAQHKIIKNMDADLDAMESIIDVIESLKAQEKEFANISEIETKLNRIEKIYTKADDLDNQVTDLESIYDKIKILEKDKIKFKHILDKSDAIDKAADQIEKVQALSSDVQNLIDLISSIQELESEIKEANFQYNKYEKEYQDAFGKEGICPLCNQKILKNGIY